MYHKKIAPIYVPDVKGLSVKDAVFLLENQGMHQSDVRLCYLVYKDSDILRLLPRFINRILLYVLPPSTDIAKHRNSIDWENLYVIQGYQAIISLYGDEPTVAPIGSNILPM